MGKNIIFLTILAMAVSFSSAFAESKETTGRAYFEKQFSQLQQSVAEVKSDTTQIVDILGSVFEGVVPSGGTLTKLCNQNGWSLVLVMGHNDVANPDKVAANTSFTYPRTNEEFQKALQKGHILHKAWLDNNPKTFRVNRIEVDTVEIDKLNVRVAKVSEKLAIKGMEVDKLTIRVAEITEKLTVKEAEIAQLRVQNAEIDHLKIRLAEVDELRIRLLAVNEALIEKLRIKDLEIEKMTIGKTAAEKRAAAAEARPAKVVTKTVYAEVGYNAPTSMRLLKDGDVCDEGVVHGGVPAAVWKATKGKSVAIFELHQRSDEDKIAAGIEFKAKSLVVVNSSTAIPMVWEDGTCIRMYKSEPLDEADFRSMMSSQEKLDSIDFSDANKKYKGRHNTTGVYLRYAK